jgi:hypothetical protein
MIILSETKLVRYPGCHFDNGKLFHALFGVSGGGVVYGGIKNAVQITEFSQ